MKKPQLERLPLKPRRASRETRIQSIDIVICIILVFFALLIIFPFWHAFVISISSKDAYAKNSFLLWPTELDFTAYKMVFSDMRLWNGYKITILLLFVGTLYQLFFTVITGYAL